MTDGSRILSGKLEDSGLCVKRDSIVTWLELHHLIYSPYRLPSHDHGPNAADPEGKSSRDPLSSGQKFLALLDQAA
ncbi:hypothetical protein PCANC_11915 [Puccinia coronata f. sp. avenae]|uniref:Uncharacterized protein n=1 Tax=Puccinia coronata f. sp. avenae TaxID=200324 RepID=A0A2N5SNT9_9BASI|nr:hypothetical protein PCANC_14785 [Puccinia coronata f. sp. avenae]PLW45424.1 hypothetical protein PCANC_11915 [Puccinia coronata f. sp. avenae]